MADNCPVIDTVVIPRDINQSLGLFLRQRTVDGVLEITGAKENSAAQGVVRSGDELIAINNQVVVGWSLTNVVDLLKNWFVLTYHRSFNKFKSAKITKKLS